MNRRRTPRVGTAHGSALATDERQAPTQSETGPRTTLSDTWTEHRWCDPVTSVSHIEGTGPNAPGSDLEHTTNPACTSSSPIPDRRSLRFSPGRAACTSSSSTYTARVGDGGTG